MRVQVQFRRDDAAGWALKNPLLAKGEPGYETDTRKLKIGDGVTLWTALPYWGGTGSGGGSVEWGDIIGKPATFPSDPVSSGDIVDFTDAVESVVSGRYVRTGSTILALDEDGVPYLASATDMPSEPGEIALDDDGVPYFAPFE